MNLKTRIRSTGMRYFASPGYLEKQREKARKQRSKRGAAAVVHYFHQVDDPYSHLAIQKLELLQASYQLEFTTHLVSKPLAEFQGSEDHFAHWARQDAIDVAADYGTEFAPSEAAPNVEAIAQANAILAQHLAADDFAGTAMQVGTALWSGRPLEATNSPQQGEQAVTEGDALRRSLGHYQGAMFYFDGEWFWGIDRIRLLEARLVEEGYAKSAGPLCVPEPTPADSTALNAEQVLFEYFPSLRSPYTAIGHQRVLDLIKRSGVQVKVRPVMPMMMRGIPAPRDKQRYIITDAAREGRAHGVPFGRIVDPFGEPVKRAFALFPGAAALDGDMEFVTAYLNAAWFEGVDITKEKGLQQVVANAGLDWQAVLNASQGVDWESQLQDNLDIMFAANLWGVPSFRVSGGSRDDAYACWGQDRIWRVDNEIARRAET